MQSRLPKLSSRASLTSVGERHDRHGSRHDRMHPENVSTFLVDWSIVTIMGNTKPPRDPDDDDDDDAEDGDAEPDEDEPAVIREPDE
jgi:hypothetical protein